MALSLNKLNIAPLEFTRVIVIVLPDPASSDTNNDFTTEVINDGTVYSVVKFVVVKSTFLFIKLFAINLKTGEVYKIDEEWKAKGIPQEDIRRDVRVIMPSLDLFGETK